MESDIVSVNVSVFKSRSHMTDWDPSSEKTVGHKS